MKPVEQITTDRLALVPAHELRWGNLLIDIIVGFLNDKAVVRYSEQRHKVHTHLSQAAYVERFFSDNDVAYWVMYLKHMPRGAVGACVGTMTATIDWRNMRAELGILLGNKSVWGTGLGKEAWAAAMNALRNVGIEKITAGMMATNTPMIKTCLSCGMRQEAEITDYFMDDEGKRVNLIIMGSP